MFRKSKYLPLFIMALALLLLPVESGAEQSSENNIVLGPAVAQIFDNENVLYSMVEFRHYFRNSSTGMLTSLEVANDICYFALGIFRDRKLISNLYSGFSISPGVISKKGEEELGYILEFRSSIELFYQGENSHRLGLSINHYSNSGLGKTNPGTESIRLMLSFPVY